MFASRSGVVALCLVVSVALVWVIATFESPDSKAPSEQDVDLAFQASVGAEAEQASQPTAAAPRAHEPSQQPSAASALPEGTPPRQGPLTELTQRFESEPRDSAAHDAERTVRAAFSRESVAPELLKSVICRQSVCKLVLRITPKRMQGYIQAVTELVGSDFDPDFAIDPARDEDADHMRVVEVYLRRRERLNL